MKKVAILQSNYVPWKGYFDLIAYVDEFIIYDDMQYTRRDWRNRNQIKTPQGVQWLSVPVKVKGKFHQSIRETEIDGNAWAQDHWKTLVLNYRRAPFFDEIASMVEPLYRADYTHLSQLNRAFIETLCLYLGIDTRIRNCWDYILCEGKSERLLDLCLQAGASTYISGPAARSYLDESLFSARGIAVEWFDYSGYSEYPQCWGAFTHGVSVLDLLFNTGKQAPAYMKFVQSDG
jgi:hypothetical protein